MSRFAIHISTKNRRQDLLFTLEKIRPLLNSDVECVVFDDGSTDGTFDAVKSGFPEVKLQRNDVSRGYIYCRNKMLNETSADYAISLDDDAHFLSENPLEEIERHFSENPKCGLIAFRIFWGSDVPPTDKTSETAHRVMGFVGCGHVWRIEAWRSIRPYPEWFEFYGEEQFAALELFRRGWEVHYLPQIFIHHRVDMKARSRMKGFAVRYRRSLRNDWHLYFLFYPWTKIPKRMAYSLWMQFRKVLRRQTRIVPPVLLALTDIVKGLPKYRRFRDPLSRQQWEAFTKLPQTKIYWNPEK